MIGSLQLIRLTTWKLIALHLPSSPLLQSYQDDFNETSEELCWLQIAWIYTVFIAVVFGGLAGLTQAILGSPGDLPDTIKCIHERGSIPIRQAPSMFICSAFSITAGGHNLPRNPGHTCSNNLTVIRFLQCHLEAWEQTDVFRSVAAYLKDQSWC